LNDERLFKESMCVSNIVKFSSERIIDFRKRFPKIVADLEIETLGKNGLAYRYKHTNNENEWKFLAPFLVDNVIDSAGAGDWCSAGLISKLCNEGYSIFKTKKVDEIENALQYGQILGSINCCFDGARGIMYSLSKEELNRHIKKTFGNKSTSFISCTHVEDNGYNIDISRQLNFSSLYSEQLCELSNT
jgi:hypothetical protein